MCISESDLIAYNQLVKESESKEELLENLKYIRDDIVNTYGGNSDDESDSDDGGRTLTLTK